MKIPAALVIAIVCFTPAFAQKMTDREYDGLKGPVMQVDKWFDTPTTPQVQQTAPKESYWSILYDRTGAIAEKTDHGAYTRRYIYTHTVNGVLEKMKGPGEDTAVAFDARSVTGYDDKGRIVSRKDYDPSGTFLGELRSTYDLNGLASLKDVYPDDSLESDESYKRDAKGDLLETIELLYAGEPKPVKTRFTYTDYKFDAKGNWIQRKETTTYPDDPKDVPRSFVHFRRITYY